MAKQTLEQKQDEKARLLKGYRAAKRKEWRELVEQEPRILSFRRWMKKQTDPASALVAISDSWLRLAPDNVRYAALGLIETHAAKMAQYQGREALDDPIPPATNFYFTAREMFAVR